MGLSKLIAPVTAKLRRNAMKPAFKPMKGPRLLSIKNATVATPTTIPERTPAIVTRLEYRPSTTPGKN